MLPEELPEFLPSVVPSPAHFESLPLPCFPELLGHPLIYLAPVEKEYALTRSL